MSAEKGRGHIPSGNCPGEDSGGEYVEGEMYGSPYDSKACRWNVHLSSTGLSPRVSISMSIVPISGVTPPSGQSKLNLYRLVTADYLYFLLSNVIVK